ncbi:uncharacterized protein C9orf43 homolog [Orycteropus afer afer]|uniref:Uncharacterized protein C9orf43 homolog n=1 Tax=Orycteropus afer afer TaxID=1230840 RepID=A0A8B6ZH22_ORYAF|nr:uncharacterized protein C9orf43 homolog [Orycteropus afer afer]
MNLPDKNQWDETTCSSAVCQHPQCWAAIRRIERGHPRILRLPHKTPLDTEDKLPVLTIVNISDSSLRPKRRAQRLPSGFTFTKARSLSRGSKFDSRFKGRSMKDLPGKGLVSSSKKPPKVSVLNLNKTLLPCPQDVGNMAVVWLPEGPEKQRRSPAEKKADVTSWDGRERRKKFAMENEFAVGSSAKQSMETQAGSQEVVVPPPSPVHLFEELNTDSILPWAQINMLPQELKELLTDKWKTMPSENMRIELAIMNKKHALEKRCPDSAISSRMFLSVQGLTLQKPGRRHPEHLRKLHYNLMPEAPFPEAVRPPGLRKQQQQEEVKTPAKVQEQEIEMKTKNDPGRKRKVVIFCDPVSASNHKVESLESQDEVNILCSLSQEATSQFLTGSAFSLVFMLGVMMGHSTLPDEESETKQQQQMEIGRSTLKQDGTEKPEMGYLKNFPDSFPRRRSAELVKTLSTKEDFSAQVEVDLESQTSSGETPMNLSANTARTTWNPELRLLRILQATDEETQPSRALSEESLEAQAKGITRVPSF